MHIARMKIRPSYLIATALAVVAVLWVLSGFVDGASGPAVTETTEETEKAPTKVRVQRQTAEMHTQELLLRGQTEASRSVELRAETSSQVEKIDAEEGSTVAAGDIIVELARDHRDARLAEAQALVRQRQVEYDAAAKLSKKGFVAETRFAETKAQLDAARASLRSMELDIADTTLRAPFDGVLETRFVEVGDFLDIGDEVAHIVDLDPMYVVVSVSERDVGKLKLGAIARARLVSGQTVEGRIHYIGSTADPETRTFRVEIDVPNPDKKLADGVSAEVALDVERVSAHRVSPAVLTLDDAGNVGIKIVNADNVVEFHVVGIVTYQPDGIWLAGLPETIDVITVGQEFVKPGQKVEPVVASAADKQ